MKRYLLCLAMVLFLSFLPTNIGFCNNSEEVMEVSVFKLPFKKLPFNFLYGGKLEQSLLVGLFLGSKLIKEKKSHETKNNERVEKYKTGRTKKEKIAKYHNEDTSGSIVLGKSLTMVHPEKDISITNERGEGYLNKMFSIYKEKQNEINEKDIGKVLNLPEIIDKCICLINDSKVEEADELIRHLPENTKKDIRRTTNFIIYLQEGYKIIDELRDSIEMPKKKVLN